MNTSIEFSTIIHNHYNEIFHYIRKQTNNTEDAKDLTQEVFMKIHAKLSSYNSSKASVRTWIYRIAHNHVINHFKKAETKNHVALDDAMLARLTTADDVLENLIQSESVASVVSVMQRILKRKHLTILNLYFFSDLTIKEIALSLAIPEKTVYNTINVSIQKIRKEMESLMHE